MSTVELFYDGNDIWDDVVVTGARFTSQVNGVAGTCTFRVKDPDQTRSFTVGKSLRLRIDGRYHWTGFVSKQTLVYGFDYLSTSGETTRFFQIEGSDINILFEKRVTYRQSNPANLVGDVYPAGTNDNVVIADLISDWLDLSGDGLDTATLVEFVGDVEDSVEFTPWHGSWKWGEAMGTVARLPVAIFYIDPDKKLVYTDVDTPSVPWVLSDEPEATTSGIGYREMRFTNDGGQLINDFLAWGYGGGSDTPVFVRDDDATSIATHGRWQAATIEQGVYKQGTINRIASSYVNGSPQSKRGHKDDRRRIELTVFDPYFRPSDKARFISSVYGIDEPFPVRSSTIEFLGPETPRFRLMLSFEIDQPWGYFDPYKFRIPPLGGIGDLPDFEIPGPQGGGGDCPPDCYLTDTFTRTVAANDWGTSDVGTVWTDSPGTGASVVEVTGSEGRLFNPAISNGGSGAGLSNAVTFQNTALIQTFDLTFDVRWESVHTGGSLEFQETIFAMRDNTGISRLQFFHGNAAPNELWLTTNGVAGEASTSFTVAAGTQYHVRWQSIANSQQRAKVWTGDTEPGSWTLTQNTSGQTAWSGGAQRMVIQTNQPSGTVSENVSAIDVYIDNLDIAGVSNCEAVQLDGYDRTVGQSTTPTLGPSTSGHDYTYFGGNSQGTIGIENGYLRMTSGSVGSFKSFSLGNGFLLPAGDGLWTRFRVKFRTSYVSSAATDHTFQIEGSADNLVDLAVDFSVSDGEIDIGAPASVAPEPDSMSVTWSLNSWYILDMVLDENQDWRGKFYREIDGEPADYNLSSDGSGVPSGSGGVIDFYWAFWDTVSGHTLDIDYVEVEYDGKPCYSQFSWDDFDDFERSVGSGWGTPSFDAEDSWLNTNISGTSSLSVGAFPSGSGLCAISSGGARRTYTRAQDSGNRPWQTWTHFVVDIRFRAQVIPSSTEYSQMVFGFWDVFATPELTVTAKVSSGVGEVSATSSNDSFSVADNSWLGGTESAGNWYRLLWDVEPGVQSRFKLYLESDGEPGAWTATLTDASAAFQETVVALFIDWSSTASSNNLFVEHIRFAPWSDLVTGDEGTGPPLSGPFCEVIAASGGGIYLITSAPFLTASEVVRVNGIIQLPGQDYSANGVEGLITMNEALDSSDTAWVCYQVNR